MQANLGRGKFITVLFDMGLNLEVIDAVVIIFDRSASLEDETSLEP